MFITQTNQIEQFGDATRNFFFWCVIKLGGNATLPKTVREASRLKCWKIMPIWRRALVSSFSERAVSSAANFYAATGWALKQVNTTDQRTFTCTRCANDAINLTSRHMQADVVQRLNGSVPLLEHFGDIGKFNH